MSLTSARESLLVSLHHIIATSWKNSTDRKRNMFHRKRGGRGRDMMDVTLVEMADHILPTMLDKNMAKIVERKLEANGVKIILGERVEEILGRDKQT
jgi:NADH dehydrogenase FAD-containing subunit